MDYCAASEISIHHFPVKKYDEKEVHLTLEQMVMIIEMVIQPRNLPVYIHCLNGSNVTVIFEQGLSPFREPVSPSNMSVNKLSQLALFFLGASDCMPSKSAALPSHVLQLGI